MEHAKFLNLNVTCTTMYKLQTFITWCDIKKEEDSNFSLICFSLLWNFHRTESWFLMNLHKTFSICAIVFTFFKLVVGDSPDTYEKLNQNRINFVFYNTCSPYRVLVINLYLCVIKCKTSDLNFLFTPNPPPSNLNICIIYESSFIIPLLYFINIPGKSNCD